MNTTRNIQGKYRFPDFLKDFKTLVDTFILCRKNGVRLNMLLYPSFSPYGDGLTAYNLLLGECPTDAIPKLLWPSGVLESLATVTWFESKQDVIDDLSEQLCVELGEDYDTDDLSEAQWIQIEEKAEIEFYVRIGYKIREAVCYHIDKNSFQKYLCPGGRIAIHREGYSQCGPSLFHINYETEEKCAGHGVMDVERFNENTRHMIVFRTLPREGTIGAEGERTRLFLTDQGYQKALEDQQCGMITIESHATVDNGSLTFDTED